VGYDILVLITLLVFMLMLSLLVMIHELGHFLSAKKFGVKVEEFGFGLPPRAIGKKIGETIYSINWLPIGGFVKLFGEDREGEGPVDPKDAPRAFYAKPLWQRSVVLVAGVSMNFLLAIVVLAYLFTQGVMVPVDRIHVEQIDAGSPAEQAGIKPNDVILSVNGKNVAKADEFSGYVKQHLGEQVTVVILRGASFVHHGAKLDDCTGCQKLALKMTPRKEPPIRKADNTTQSEPNVLNGAICNARHALHIPDPPRADVTVPKQGPIGVLISTYETRTYAWYQAPFYGTWEAIKISWELVKGIGMTIWKLISFQSVSKEVAGPIGIAEMTGQARRAGVQAVLELMGLLSLNLAIVNILPFPALDGGRLLFVLIEAFSGKKLKSEVERYVHQIGMIILLTLILLVTINDVVKVFMNACGV
jgi:regulator of sigma E protease